MWLRLGLWRHPQHPAHVNRNGEFVSVRSLLDVPARWRTMKGTAMVRLPNGVLRTVELRWYEAHGIGKRDLKIKRYFGLEMKAAAKSFALCIDNSGYQASLIPGKVYRILPDPRA